MLKVTGETSQAATWHCILAAICGARRQLIVDLTPRPARAVGRKTPSGSPFDRMRLTFSRG